MSTAALHKYTDAIDEIPEEAFLGSLLFFSISNADVNLNNAHRDLKNLGLSTDHMRQQLRPLDAFAKSSKRFEKKFKPANGIRSELLVRRVGEETGPELFRWLVIERSTIEAGVKKQVSYDKVGELRFTKGHREKGEYVGHKVECMRDTDGGPGRDPVLLTAEEDHWLTEQLATFADNYDHLLNYMDSHAVRTFVREFIYGLSGVCVKESGGLYFVKQKHADDVSKLQSWVKSVGSEFHSLPLLNLEDQRTMIAQAFEDEAVREVDSLMAEITKILSDPSRKIEEKTFDAYGQRAAELTLKMKEYNEMLNCRTETAETQIQLYGRQMMKLAGRIKTTRTS